MPRAIRQADPRGRLVAVLANPTTRSSTRTEQRIALAAGVLGYSDWVIVNLFPLPSASSRDIDRLGRDPSLWLQGRAGISYELNGAVAVLVGFGTIPTSRETGDLLARQLAWLSDELTGRSSIDVWQIGIARHPSRWHQYLGAKHGRTSGGSFAERISESLTQVPVDGRRWEHRAHVRRDSTSAYAPLSARPSRRLLP